MVKVIGITGPFGSGKTTASLFLEKNGFTRISLSNFLEENLIAENKEITRKNLQDLGNIWREKEGSGALAKKALDYISANKLEKIVIDGIRNLGEIEEFRNKTDFILVGLIANRDIRFERVKKMKRREALTRDLFDELDYRDLGIYDDSPKGLQVAKCLAISDYFINTNDENGYKERLTELLKQI